MKSKKEIQKYLGNYKIGLFDLITVQGYLHAKGIEANFALGDGKNITATSFIDWFENKSKKEQIKENLDTIIINGKEYEFFEEKESHCYKCDLMKIGRGRGDCKKKFCNNRSDNKEGYFKLKNIQEQKLELIPNEFYTVKIDDVIIDTLIFEGTTQDMLCFGYSISFQGRNKNTLWTGYDENIKYARSYQLASPEEKQKLIDAVEKQEGKLWNEETKTFEDKPKDILVPENIKIIKYQNNELGLVFNNNKQVLTFSEGIYMVMPFDKLDKFIPCKLEAIRFGDLKDGDLFYDNAIESQQRLVDIRNYKIKKRYTDTISINSNNGIILDSCYNMQSKVYKLIPIK